MVHLVDHLLAVSAAGAAGLSVCVAVAAAVSTCGHRGSWSFRVAASDLVPTGAGVARATRDLKASGRLRSLLSGNPCGMPVI